MSGAPPGAATRLSIGRLGAADLADYKRLRDAMLASHPEAFTSDAAAERGRDAASYATRLGADGGSVFTLGARERGELVGALSCEHDPRVKVRHIVHLVGMMVRDGSHGRGIGRALLGECIARARGATGIELVTLSVTATNAAAVGLYESTGFVRYGTLPRAIRVGDRDHAKHLMVLAL